MKEKEKEWERLGRIYKEWGKIKNKIAKEWYFDCLRFRNNVRGKEKKYC